MFDLTAHLTPDLAWRKAGGAGGVTPAFQADFTGLTSLPSWLSLSRAGNAMVTDSTGMLTYAPNNLLTQSNNFSDAAWTKDQTGTVSVTGIADPFGGTAASTFTAGASGGRLYQNALNGLLNATNGLSTVWLRRRTGTGDVSMFQSNAGGVPITITGTWAQYTLVVAGLTSNGFAGIQLSTNGDAVDIYAPTLSCVTYETTPRSADQVITTSAAYYGPRFDHAWNGSAWVATGLMDEEQRTNNALHSGTIGGTDWSLFGGATVSTNAVVSPDGTTSGTTITFAADASSQVYQAQGGSAATYSLSVWAKSSTGKKFRIVFTEGAVNRNSPDFTTTSSWQRFTFVWTATGGVSQISICNVVAADAGPFDAWGFQFEPGVVATSYIPTTTAAVTRSADIPSATSPLDGYLAAGPSVWEFQDEATGVISRTAYAAGAFDWPVNKWYRSMGVYPAGTDTSSHMTVGSAY